MKFPDLFSVVMFFVGLCAMIGVSFGGAYFAARWRRNFLIWSPLGLFLYKLGLSVANGTLRDLQKGKLYVVSQDFTDYHGASFQAGETLTFVKHEYFSYHGGHVLQFEQRAVFLQEAENAAILREIWAYLEPTRSK